MGQRHQIYLFVQERKGLLKHKGKRLGFGLHHQWLYGETAGTQALRMMEYQAKASKETYHPLNGTLLYNGDEPRQVLKAMYQINPETGYYSDSLSELNEYEKGQVERPDTGDNNDGITVFDFTDPKKPTYCMMNICGQEKNSECVYDLPELTPVSIEEYVRTYYPIGGTGHQKEHWKATNFKHHEKNLAKLFKRASKFSVMTLERAKKLFPKMYKKDEELKALKKAGVDLTEPISRAKIKEILSQVKA